MSLKFKSLNDGTIQIEGVGIPFGGPVNGKDLHGQFFSTKTDFAWDLIPDGHRPLLYQHGLDDTLKTNVIGRWSVKKVDDKGVWITAQLNARAEYLDEIKELISKDSLGLSSATMGHLVKVSSKSGEILRWPVVEMSLTPNPANPHAYVVKTAAPVEAAEYVAAKLAVLKYSENQSRDERGRFGGGGGGDVPTWPGGSAHQGPGWAGGAAGRAAERVRQASTSRTTPRDKIDKGISRGKTLTSEKSPLALSRTEKLDHADRLDNIDRFLSAGSFGRVATYAEVGQQRASEQGASGLADVYRQIKDAAVEVHGFMPPKSWKADTVYAEGTGLVDGLRDLLSDVVAFYLEAHGAHWNVVGDDFKQYHDLFGEIYEDVHGSVDPLAENIRKLNASAPFDLRDIASDPALNNASGAVNAEDLCEELYASNSVLLMKILSCFNMATEAGEQGIANFLAERQDAHKKWAWQLSASLDERGEQTEVEEAAESPELELDMSKSAKYSEDQERDERGRFGSGGGGGAWGGDGNGANAHSDHLASVQERIMERAKNEAGGNFRLQQAARFLEQSKNTPLDKTSFERVTFRDKIRDAMDVLEAENHHDLVGELDEILRDSRRAKSFDVDPNTDEPVQPAVRLAIKAGKTTERKAADPEEVKKQMRALARDLAIKSVRK